MYQNFITMYQIFLKFFLECEKFLTIFHSQFKIIFIYKLSLINFFFSTILKLYIYYLYFFIFSLKFWENNFSCIPIKIYILVNKIFIYFMNFITYELKKIIFSYYFKILYFHMKINSNDYDFRLFLIKYDLNLCLG